MIGGIPWFVALGAGVLFLLCLWLVPGFGKLPGDIEIKGDGYYFYLPITSSAIFATVMSVLVAIFKL